MAQVSRIVIADENRVDIKALSLLLEGPEFSITVANSGEEALEVIASDPPDLLMCDIIMHGMSGFDVCRLLRDRAETRDMPIYLMSSTETREMKAQVFECGADGFIGKPFQLAEVRGVVKNISRLNRMNRLAEQREQIAQSYLDIQRSYDQTIEGWVRALDLRDNETENHSQRVAQLTVELAQRMEMDDETITQIWRGALLHDVGKIGVPDSILHKNGKLTEEEYAIMKRHPEFAYELLSPIEYLRPAIDIPYCHHEKWDGTGYPLGIAGEDIPLPARMFAVVDVYDALRSDRPYKRGWTEEETLAEIKKMAGTHFDPRVVEVFIRMRLADTALPWAA